MENIKVLEETVEEREPKLVHDCRRFGAKRVLARTEEKQIDIDRQAAGQRIYFILFQLSIISFYSFHNLEVLYRIPISATENRVIRLKS
jgi:hypothetical protein